MIFREIRLPANPEGLAPLTLEQIWQGLEQKARDAVPYVEAITSCRVIAEESDTVFDREVLLGGARYVERIWLGKPYLVVFTRTAGPVLGTIINEILEEDGELSLRFQLALNIAPGTTLPISLSHRECCPFQPWRLTQSRRKPLERRPRAQTNRRPLAGANPAPTAAATEPWSLSP